MLKDANAAIIEALEQAGALLKQEAYGHRYPYDWRTKKPTIFRATEQWFASVDGFRQQALDAIDAVERTPASGRNRIEAMVKERGDWCISPSTHLGCADPGLLQPKQWRGAAQRRNPGPHRSADRRTRRRRLVGEGRSRAGVASRLCRPGRAMAQGDRHHGCLVRIPAPAGQRWPSRASSSAIPPTCTSKDPTSTAAGSRALLTSVAVNGHAPHKRVLTHGFALDEKGRKMSKSLGNVVDPMVIIEGGKNQKQEPPYGADVLRLWVSSVDYSADVPIGAGTCGSWQTYTGRCATPAAICSATSTISTPRRMPFPWRSFPSWTAGCCSAPLK